MSESSNSFPVKVYNHSERMKGNKNAAKLTYDERQIRDALKGTIYRAVKGLTLTTEEANQYYTREDATVLEKMFYEAMTRKNWQVFDMFMVRTLGTSAIKQTAELPNLGEGIDLTKLDENELQQLKRLHSKIAVTDK